MGRQARTSRIRYSRTREMLDGLQRMVTREGLKWPVWWRGQR